MTREASNVEPNRPSATPFKTAAADVAGGGEPPYYGGMEHRMTALETRLDTILPTLATKADLEGLRVQLEGFRLSTRADIDALRSASKADIDALRLATKADIDALRLATKADIDVLRLATKAEFEASRLATRVEIAALQSATKAEFETLRLTTKAELEALRLSTSAEIEALRISTKAGIDAIRAELEKVALRIDAKFSDLRSDMHKMHAGIKTWMLATVISMIGTMLAAVLTISQIYKGTASAVPARHAPSVAPASPR